MRYLASDQPKYTTLGQLAFNQWSAFLVLLGSTDLLIGLMETPLNFLQFYDLTVREVGLEYCHAAKNWVRNLESPGAQPGLSVLQSWKKRRK